MGELVGSVSRNIGGKERYIIGTLMTIGLFIIPNLIIYSIFEANFVMEQLAAENEVFNVPEDVLDDQKEDYQARIVIRILMGIMIAAIIARSVYA